MNQSTATAALRQQGLNALKRGQLDLAVNAFSTMLAQQPDNLEALAGLGTALSQKGSHDQALELLKRTVQLKPASAALRFNWGLALERAGKKLLAGEAYEQTLRLNPAHVQAKHRLAALEAALAGGALPTASPDEETLPIADPEVDLPTAAPEEDLPSAEPEREVIAVSVESIRPPAPVQPIVPSVIEPAVVVAPPPRRSVAPPPLWDGKPSAALRTPSPATPKAPSAVQPARKSLPAPKSDPADAILVTPVEGSRDEILDVLPADGPAATTVTIPAAQASAPAGLKTTLKLAEGESFESWVTYEIAEVDSDRLALRSRDAMAFLWILAAPVSVILAVVIIVWLIGAFAEGSSIKVRGLIGLLFGLFFVVGLCIAAVLKLRQLGSRLVFDSRARTCEVSRWFGMSRQTWSESELGGVHVAFSPAKTDEVQELKATLVASDGGVVAELGEEKVSGQPSTVLLMAAAYVSHLLRIPLQIEGQPHDAHEGLADIYRYLNRPNWNAQTQFETLDRQAVVRSGHASPDSFGALRTVGLVFYGIFGLGFVALSLFLAASGAFPWEGALVCVIIVGVGIMLFMNGLSGIRSRQIYARHVLFNHEYRGSTAVMIGWGQIAAGAIPVVAIPLVLFFQADWGKAFRRADGPEFVQPGAGPNPLPGRFAPPQPQAGPGQNPLPPAPQAPHVGSAGPSIDKLLDDLNSPVAFTRRQAVDQLARMTPNERRAEVAIALRTKLDPHDHFQVQSVLKALEVWGDDRDVPAIMNLLDSQNPFIRREAISALGRRKSAAAARPIADRLRYLSDRLFAASALRSIGTAAEWPTLELLKDSDPRVREEALKVLRDIATRESIPALREAVNDEDRTVSGIAQSILRDLGDTASARSTNPGRPRPRPGEPSSGRGMNTNLTRLIEDVNDFDATKRRAACEALQSIQPVEERREEVALALNKALEDSNPLTRRAAVRALAGWATKENVHGLISLLEDRDSFVRTAVFETLAKLKDERSIDPIAKRLENIFDRPQASKALQEMGPLAEATVLLGLRSRDPQTRQEVCKILKVIGTKGSVATLNQFVVAANRSGDRAAAALADEAVKAINEREKGGKD